MNRILMTMLLLVYCASLQSCNVVAGLSYVMAPEPSKEAMYALPNVRTVVFVDDRQNILHPSRLKRIFADEITDKLLQEQIITTLISPQDVMRYASNHDKHDDPISIQSVGEAVNASTVIYVEMAYFTLTNDGTTPKPSAGCYVRVIDINNKTRVFPVDRASFLVTAELQRVTPNQIRGAGAIKQLAEDLILKLGDKVSKVFYKHFTGRLGDNLGRK